MKTNCLNLTLYLMQPTIDKILVVIIECKNPIKNTPGRSKRDAILEDIGVAQLRTTREDVEEWKTPY